MKLTNFSIKHYMAVLVLCLGILILGWQSYRALPRESFPDVRIPYVIVTAVQDGANPTDIETSVTIPLETAIDGTEGMKEMTSSSFEGVSVVTIEFYPDVPSETALQRIRDAVDIAKQDLPPDVDEPTVKEFSLASIPILIYDLVGSKDVSRSQLQELAENLQDEIKLIPGILDVEIYGGREEQVIIEIDPERVHFYQLQLASVLGIVRGSNRNVSVGTSESKTNRIIMRVPGEFRTPGDVMALVIGASPDGAPVYLRDVAVARFDYEDEKTRARAYDFLAEDGESSVNRYVPPDKSVSLHVTKRSGENILRIAEDVDGVLQRYPLPNSVSIVKGLDQSKSVRMMVSDLENGIGTALVLVLIVIFIGLGVRNAVLVSLAIPFSMLTSIFILRLMGETLNMMVLFSLILALGMLVDNAIVIVENIYRHYCLGLSRAEAAMKGTAEVAWPVITSTATTVGAFLPLLFWPDVIGEFMSFIPKTVIIVLLCSLFVALVINPTLASLLMKRPRSGTFSDPETQRPTYWAVRQYRKALEFVLGRPYWAMTTSFLLLPAVLALYVAFGAGVEFFPNIDPEFVTCNITPPEGSSLEAANRFCRAAEDRILGAPGSGYDEPIPNLKHVSVTVGLDDGGGGAFFSGPAPVNFQMEFVSREHRIERTTVSLEDARNRILGLDRSGNRVTFPLYGAEYNVEEQQEGPPTGKPVSIDIYGRDLNEMTRVARDMKQLMAETEGTTQPTDDAATAAPTLEWDVDLARAGMFALDQATVSDFLSLSVGGIRSGTIGHGDDEKDILLRFPRRFRARTDRIETVFIPTPLGGSVPMVSVASADLVPGPVTIRHHERRRVITASAEVQSGIRADSDIRKKFQEKVADYTFPTGITYRFGGAADDEEASKAFLLGAFLTAVFIIVIILVMQFNSVWVTGIVMVSVVLAQMGVFLGLLLLGMPFGIIMTGIAVISLAGVVVNNAIVLLDAIRQFQNRGLDAEEAIVTASMIRFRPVLLTAITTILGLVPMALKLNWDFVNFTYQYDTDSSQWWQSMATAIIFGLLVATVLTLGVVPTLYLIYTRAAKRVGSWYRANLAPFIR